jgi:paraquat-inducible protein B
VGFFVTGACLLFILIIVVLGASKFLSSDTEYALYFDSSVSGLSKGAPVVFRGVPLGSVTRIRLVASEGDVSKVLIPVMIQIDAKTLVRMDGGTDVSEAFERELVQRMVKAGMRARLQMQSIITGQYRVELDFYPGAPLNFKSHDPALEIPTIPSPLDSLQRAIEKLPMEQLVLRVDNILASLAKLSGDEEITEGIHAFAETFRRAKEVFTPELTSSLTDALKRLDEVSQLLTDKTPESLAYLNRAFTSVHNAAQEVRQLAQSLQEFTGKNSKTVQESQRLLQEAVSAARALRELATTLERNPEVLLRGRQAPR